MLTIRDYINGTLDKEYKATAGSMLEQIAGISKGAGTPTQRALQDLELKATQLQDGSSVLYFDDAELAKALAIIRTDLNLTAEMMVANSPVIEKSGAGVAIAAVIAKIFSGTSQDMINAGMSPIDAKAMTIFTDYIASNNIGFFTPQPSEIMSMITSSEAFVEKLSKWGDGYADLIAAKVKEGLASGWGPIRTAREIRKYAEGIPLNAAYTWTRTLQLQSYRNASAQMELLNGRYIEKKIRISALSPRTCPACIALHGTEVPIGVALRDHYSGLCDSILIPIGGSMPTEMQAMSTPGNRNFVPFSSGEEWFVGLSDTEQRQFLGPGKFDLYKSGTPLSAFVGTYADDVFGDMPVVKPIKDL